MAVSDSTNVTWRSPCNTIQSNSTAQRQDERREWMWPGQLAVWPLGSWSKQAEPVTAHQRIPTALLTIQHGCAGWHLDNESISASSPLYPSSSCTDYKIKSTRVVSVEIINTARPPNTCTDQSLHFLHWLPAFLHRVSKNCAKLFLSELHQIFTNFDNFWQRDGK